MCFNATVSFATAAVLVPLGARTIATARHGDPRYFPLAGFPLWFGIQQAMEGLLWLELASGAADPLVGQARWAALGFLFFAYLVWPALVPYAAWRVEPDPQRQRLFAIATGLGALLGLSLFVPLIVFPDWLEVGVAQGSILYRPRLIYEPWIRREGIRVLYAGIVALPLLASTEARVRRFGGLILGSVILTALAFDHAFVSVWCLFAAILSVYLALCLPSPCASAERPQGPAHRGGGWHPRGV